MDSLSALKRRTASILNALPRSLPSMASTKSQNSPSMKGTWESISVPPLPRSSHSVDIVAGTAYIFGGQDSPRAAVDNDMHAVTLPCSSAPADCYAITARSARQDPAPIVGGEESIPPATGAALDDVPLGSSPELWKGKGVEQPPLGDVPPPRLGHASAVIGSRIFLFGGRGGPEAAPLDERGRVWVFDTRTHTWSYLDPALPVDPSVASAIEGTEPRPHYPSPRSQHAAAATEKPSDFTRGSAPTKPRNRSESWKQWATGDSDKVGIPQRPIVGNVAAEATDADADGFGTFIIHGGDLATGPTSDTWAFDIRSRVWRELPSAPDPPCSGTALCISKSRLYRFGGSDGRAVPGGRLDVLDLELETIDDQRTVAGEVALAARGTWGSLTPPPEDRRAADDPAAPLAHPAANAWPGPRAAAALQALNVGGGREYLVLALGERDPGGEGGGGDGAASSQFWDDVWVFQVPPQGMSTASVHDAVLQAVGRKSGEGMWTKVAMGPYDEEDEAAATGPGPRGWVASALMGDVEENGIIIWGGVGGAGRQLGDGWILRLD